MTNPAPDKNLSNKFVVGERDGLDVPTPRGTIKIKTYQNIAEVGKERFMIKYQHHESKTRDYFKEKSFAQLKEDLDESFKNLRGDEKLKFDNTGEIYLSDREIGPFLHNNKIKHLNLHTIEKFSDEHKETENPQYKLSRVIAPDKISLEIHKKVPKGYALILRKEYYHESKNQNNFSGIISRRTDFQR